MATGTHAGSTWNTTAGNKTVVATPAASDLIVVVHGMSGWASGDDSTITDNNSDGNGTYTKIGASPLSTGGGTAGALWISIRNALIGSASSTTFTATNSGDTGGGLTVMRFSGVTKTGSTAARQNKGEAGTENPPSIAFPAATLTTNPIVLGVFGEDNPAGVTPPGGFSEAVDTGWAQPTSGVEVCWDDAGNTASSYAWSGGALADHNEVAVEVDTAIPDIIGTLSVTQGADTNSASGTILVSATLSLTQGADTVSASGTVAVVGALAQTQGADTISASGTVAGEIVGTLSVTQGADTITASAEVAVSATLSLTQGADTLSGSGAVPVSAALSLTQGADVLSASGSIEVFATLAATQGSDTLSASGSVGTPEIIGTLSLTQEANDCIGCLCTVAPFIIRPM